MHYITEYSWCAIIFLQSYLLALPQILCTIVLQKFWQLQYKLAGRIYCIKNIYFANNTHKITIGILSELNEEES